MSIALPAAPDYDAKHLRHLLPSACAALGLEGFHNSLGVPSASVVVMILADGLGDENLATHTGHARFLASAWRKPTTAQVLDCGAPATTSVSLTSLGTGAVPGEHGITGYDVYAPELNRVVNMLGGWDDQVDPKHWQQLPTVFQSAQALGAGVLTASRSSFKNSPLTQAALSGGEFRGADRMEQRFAAAAEWIDSRRGRTGSVTAGPAEPLLIYLYVDELDRTGHRAGVGSDAWRQMLELLDETAARFSRRLNQRYGDSCTVLLSADHGMVDISSDAQIDVSADETLMAGVQHTSGDPRMMYLHLNTGVDEEVVADRWRQRFQQQAWVLTRTEAIRAGWFGHVTDENLPRIGDVIIAAHQPVAFFDIARTGTGPLSMVGMHGSLTKVERSLPLLELTGRSFI